MPKASMVEIVLSLKNVYSAMEFNFLLIMSTFSTGIKARLLISVEKSIFTSAYY